MISKPIKNILEEFDNILEQLKTNDKTKKYLVKVASDINLLKLWREELQSGKQSIFVPGKMSTGKSSFLNFLLDKEDEKDCVFKTATKTETSIIQTLEHCKTNKESNAEVIIKDIREFKKLDIPKSIRCEYKDNSFVIPLDNREQIIFFREKIIAKSEENAYYESIKAITQINIKHPLVFFKSYKIIDTPGLGASKDGDETEKIVRANYQGKSHVFWFLDASKRTMSDNLTLLVEEKELLMMNFDRIHFIANKFDLMDYDDDNRSKAEVIKRMTELTNALKETLDRILEREIDNPSIIFTSLKKPKKKFGDNNTITSIEKLEDQLLKEKKDTSYNNISALIVSMKPILKKLKKHVITEEQEKIDNKIRNLNIEKKRINTEYTINQNKKREALKIINSSIEEIKNIKKEKNLNTHERYNTYIKHLNNTINKSANKIKNALDRIDTADKCKIVNIKLNSFKFIKNLSLKEKESGWKKYIHDSELDKKKEDLNTYIPIKIGELKGLEVAIDECIDNLQLDTVVIFENKISALYEDKKNIEKKSQIINDIKSKLNNINSLLLDDLDIKISEWNPVQDSENSSLLSFLELYALLEEHELVMNKII